MYKIAFAEWFEDLTWTELSHNFADTLQPTLIQPAEGEGVPGEVPQLHRPLLRPPLH